MPASLREKRDHFRIALAQIHAHVSGSRDAENYLQGILAREPTNWALWDAYASILRLGERQREAEKVYAKLLNSGLITSSSWRLSICEGYCELLWQRECYDAIAEQLTKCCLGESGALPLSAASVLKIKKIISTSANNAEHLTALLESAISRIPQLPSTAPTSSKRMKNPNLCTSSVNDLQRLAALVQRGHQTEAESLLFSLMDKHPYQLCSSLLRCLSSHQCRSSSRCSCDDAVKRTPGPRSVVPCCCLFRRKGMHGVRVPSGPVTRQIVKSRRIDAHTSSAWCFPPRGRGWSHHYPRRFIGPG